MQRSISRRDFGKRLAGGVALLALQPAWNYPAGGQSLRNDLKDISGELSFDDAVLQATADDFGRVVQKKPAAVLRPSDAQDIAKLVQFANRQGVKIAMRGQGHSFFGQGQVADGVVIDSSSRNAVRIVKSGAAGTAEIGAGSKWHPVRMAANAQKLTVPVITDTFLSVGGTISTGGFGVTTYNLGLQVDQVQELEAVTGDGQIVTCSDERNSDLFNAMLGGLGQCGIITKVVMRLMDAPTNVLFIKMDYDDFQSASADLALLAKDGRFHHLDGRGAVRPTGGVGGSGWAGRPLWSDDIPGDQALRAPADRTLSDDPDRTAVGVDARENLLSVSAYGRQRQSHDKCSGNSRRSRHDVSPVAFSAEPVGRRAVAREQLVRYWEARAGFGSPDVRFCLPPLHEAGCGISRTSGNGQT
jgi:FAD/FMN-containing dehydrogenase